MLGFRRRRRLPHGLLGHRWQWRHIGRGVRRDIKLGIWDIDGFRVFMLMYWAAVAVCAWLAPPEARVPIIAAAVVVLPFLPFLLPVAIVFLIIETFERML